MTWGRVSHQRWGAAKIVVTITVVVSTRKYIRTRTRSQQISRSGSPLHSCQRIQDYTCEVNILFGDQFENTGAGAIGEGATNERKFPQ